MPENNEQQKLEYLRRIANSLDSIDRQLKKTTETKDKKTLIEQIRYIFLCVKKIQEKVDKL